MVWVDAVAAPVRRRGPRQWRIAVGAPPRLPGPRVSGEVWGEVGHGPPHTPFLSKCVWFSSCFPPRTPPNKTHGKSHATRPSMRPALAGDTAPRNERSGGAQRRSEGAREAQKHRKAFLRMGRRADVRRRPLPSLTAPSSSRRLPHTHSPLTHSQTEQEGLPLCTSEVEGVTPRQVCVSAARVSVRGCPFLPLVAFPLSTRPRRW